jgi:threonine dehydratase
MISPEKNHWTDAGLVRDPGGMLTFDDVVAAAEVVAGHVAATPVVSHPLLDRAVGREVLVKHEQVLPTGSFKVRGGLYLAARLTTTEARRGLVTASTGNHAQSVAYAARTAGVGACVVMPTTAPSCKADAVEALGAEVIRHGDSLGEAAAHARQSAEQRGAAYVDPTDPRIVLGHATTYLELFSTHTPAAVYVPIGSGTGAAGACLVRDELAPACRIVGVQSAAAPAGWRSWRSGRIETATSTTRASGLATTTGYALPQAILADRLDDFLLVTDDRIDAAARDLALLAHTLVEGAGAASLAGLLADRRPPDGPLAVVCTGGNASPGEIARLAA